MEKRCVLTRFSATFGSRYDFTQEYLHTRRKSHFYGSFDKLFWPPLSFHVNPIVIAIWPISERTVTRISYLSLSDLREILMASHRSTIWLKRRWISQPLHLKQDYGLSWKQRGRRLKSKYMLFIFNIFNNCPEKLPLNKTEKLPFRDERSNG